ncbi:hypothetical protein [Galactobacillus timonensis]|uniref:hypothetical protein n=1 Tax=Galactobacillus timonensis TaxID=2041840 RepID=UPI000C82A4F5|nr:hypothetical protein [Galactobacillus timonensis]
MNNYEKDLEDLAGKLNDFGWEVLPYESGDNFNSPEEALEDIKESLREGQTDHYREYLQSFLDEGIEVDFDVQGLIDDIDKFQKAYFVKSIT